MDDRRAPVSGPSDDEELRRRRADLYRRDPPPDAVMRYRELLGPVRAEASAAGGSAAAGPVATGSVARRRRPILRWALGIGAVLAVSGSTAAALLHGPVRGSDVVLAVPVSAAGPTAVTDSGALRSLLGSDPAAVGDVLEAIRDSDAGVLDVWDSTASGAWTQRGTGPATQRFDGAREPADETRTFSVLVQCATRTGYRWTLSGTTRSDPAVHVLAAARSADCGPTPTAATFSRPAGSVVRAFDFRIGGSTRWAMTFVYPIGR